MDKCTRGSPGRLRGSTFLYCYFIIYIVLKQCELQLARKRNRERWKEKKGIGKQ